MHILFMTYPTCDCRQHTEGEKSVTPLLYILVYSKFTTGWLTKKLKTPLHNFSYLICYLHILSITGAHVYAHEHLYTCIPARIRTHIHKVNKNKNSPIMTILSLLVLKRCIFLQHCTYCTIGYIFYSEHIYICGLMRAVYRMYRLQAKTLFNFW